MIQRNATLKRMDINPVTFIIIILSLMLSIIFSKTLLYNSIILSSIFIFVIINDQFTSLLIIPINRFKVFILFSLLFMLLSDYTLFDVTIYTFKILILLLLSSIIDRFLDHNYLLIFFDSSQ